VGGLVTTTVAGLAGLLTFVSAAKVVGLAELGYLATSLRRRG
jgi:putative peptidoglycan lipid II flippase